MLSAPFPYPVAAHAAGHPMPVSHLPGATWGRVPRWAARRRHAQGWKGREGAKIPWDPQWGQRCCSPFICPPMPGVGLFVVAHHCNFCNWVFFLYWWSYKLGSKALGKSCRMVCAGDLVQASLPWASPTTAPSWSLTYAPSVDLEAAQSQPFVLFSRPILCSRGLWSLPEISPA